MKHSKGGPPPIYNGIDHCTYANARTLSLRVRDYWAAQGYEITVLIGSMKVNRGNESPEIYFVRSNLVNGLPQKKPSSVLA